LVHRLAFHFLAYIAWACVSLSIHLFLFPAAARALMSVGDMPAEEVAQRAMDIASDMCVYTNKNFVMYTLDDVSDGLAAPTTETTSKDQ
jgi:hypothetical protein